MFGLKVPSFRLAVAAFGLLCIFGCAKNTGSTRSGTSKKKSSGSDPKASAEITQNPNPADKHISDLSIISASGTCLTAMADTVGATVRAKDCSNAGSQDWTRWPLSNQLTHAGLCLTAVSDATGAGLILQSCQNLSTQQWKFENKKLQNSTAKCVKIDSAIYGALSLSACSAATAWTTAATLPTSCWISLSSCPQHVETPGWFQDTLSNSNQSRSACLARAQEYANWCSSPNSVTAYFGVSGAYVAQQSYTRPYVAPVPSYGCTESGIRAAIAGGLTYLDCSNKDVVISATIIIQRDNFKLYAPGAHFTWRSNDPTQNRCDQSEGGQAMFDIYGSNNTLQGFEVINAPDGIHVSSGSNNTLDGLVYNRVCEDAITNGGHMVASATDTMIKNSVFKNASDKVIQVNGGTITVRSNRFEDVGKAIATGGSHAVIVGNRRYPAQAKTIYASRNKIKRCKAAGMRVSSSIAKLNAEDNEFEDCCPALQVTDGGRLHTDDNDYNGCKKPIEKE